MTPPVCHSIVSATCYDAQESRYGDNEVERFSSSLHVFLLEQTHCPKLKYYCVILKVEILQSENNNRYIHKLGIKKPKTIKIPSYIILRSVQSLTVINAILV